jgi:malate dehydrogenase (oxaloacetate-decarboxylating)(NADP+)
MTSTARLSPWCAILNARLSGAGSTVKLVTSGAGAAALACLNLLVIGHRPRNIYVTDLAGVVVYEAAGPSQMDEDKIIFAQKTDAHAQRHH